MAVLQQDAAKTRPGGKFRACVSCGTRATVTDLLRVTALPEGELVLDWRRRLGGRGAHVCAVRGCIERAVSRRAFDRPLRVRARYPEAGELIDAARTAYGRRLETLLRSALGAGVLVSGTDAVLEALNRGSLRCLAVARDAAGASRMRNRAATAGIPCEVVLDKKGIGALLDRPDTGVFGITDPGSASAFRRILTGLEGLG